MVIVSVFYNPLCCTVWKLSIPPRGDIFECSSGHYAVCKNIVVVLVSAALALGCLMGIFLETPPSYSITRAQVLIRSLILFLLKPLELSGCGLEQGHPSAGAYIK